MAEDRDQLWGVRFTLSDVDSKEFVCLGGAMWKTEKRGRAEFDALPTTARPADDQNAYLADYWTPDGHVDDKYVTAETIEAKMGQPIAELIAEGWKAIRQMEADLVSRKEAIDKVLGREPDSVLSKTLVGVMEREGS